MPDLEISNLPALPGTGLNGNDPVAIADLSASETKKITAKDLVQSGVALVDDASIPAAKVAALGSAQLAANSVGSSQIADNSVDTAAIQASAVTDAKIASGVSGSKLSDGTVTAAKLGTVTNRGLDQVGGNIGHTNTVTAGTAAGITFDSQGHITATGAIPASDLPLATTTTVGGVIVPTDGGLEVSVTGEVRHEHDVTADIVANISFDEHGHINYVTELQPGHLPIALTNAVGAVQVPAAQGLSIDASGSIGLTNTGVTAGTYTKITVDAYGRATTGTTLSAADIPDLNVSKLTAGTLATARIADDAVTAAKLADRSTTTIAETTPASGAFIGQTHLNSLTGDYYLWDGNVWQPIGISVGEIVLAGTYDASTNLLDSVTAEGSAAGFTNGASLPSAATNNTRYYVVVSQTGTGTAPAPTVTLEPPDILLSNGTSYVLIETSETITAQIASNVGFTPYGDINSTNVQGAIAELDDEKVSLAGDTMTGDLTLGDGVNLVFEGATANDYETTVTVDDPTADNTITIPNETGTVVTTGASGVVTSAMIADGAIVNADINANAEIAVSKLADGAARQLLQTDAAGTGVEWTSNVDIPGTLDVTGAATFDSTASHPLGSASAPTIAFTGDIDTGIYSPGANQVAISTGGTGRLFVDASGNVGLGTSSPSERLTVSGNISCNGTLDLTDSTIDLYSQTTNAASKTYQQFSDIGGTQTEQVYFKANGEAYFRGNVGIGTTSPTKKLQVEDTSATSTSTFANVIARFVGAASNGDANIQFSNGVNSSANIGIAGGANLYFGLDGVERARIDSSGRLLVGTSTSAGNNLLQIKGDAVATTGVGSIFLQRGLNIATIGISGNVDLAKIEFGNQDGAVGAVIQANADATWSTNDYPSRLTFSTTADGASSPTERMRITSLGSITVGSASTQGDSFFTVRGTHTSNVANAYTIRQFADIPASVTGTVFGFHSSSNVVNGATLGTYAHFSATQGSITGSSITTQIGFSVSSALTHATNNYGFHSDIASGTNRWNFYANGTASNYFAGLTFFGVNNTGNVNSATASGAYVSASGVRSSSRDATTTSNHHIFYNPNGVVGTISTSGSATAYNTSSDYRLKENITPMVGAADRVKALKPCRFNFIADANRTVDGFLAHEAQEIVPESVTGTKDEMEDIGTLTEWDGTILETDTPEPDSLTWDETITDEDGNETIETRTRTWVKTGDRPVMQGIDQAKLVPLLTGALQEALAEIDALKQRLTDAGL